MTTLLLSDLHLPEGPSPLREAFLQFLGGPARNARAVYILGDLFEFWMGDDSGLQDYSAEVTALQALTSHGVEVYFQHGNRDFLIGERFVCSTGVKLLQDPIVVNLEGHRTLISHGDLLCTDDKSYQRFRRVMRNRLVQWLFLRMPLQRRQRIAGGVRSQTSRQKNEKPKEIMDVNPAAVTAALRNNHVNQLIHGHTHRPDLHSLQVDGRDCTRLVLADWRPQQMEYLRVDASGARRIKL